MRQDRLHSWYKHALELEKMRKRKQRAARPRCSARGCDLHGYLSLTGAFGECLFCARHYKIWREHNRIVQRIRGLG